MNHLTNHPRYVQALWYAYGQQDAGIGRGIDIFEFAIAQASLVESKPSFLPSIQDAWRTCIRQDIRTAEDAAADAQFFAADAMAFTEDGMADLDAIDNGYVDEDATRADR